MRLDIECVRDVLLEFEQLPIGRYTLNDFPDSISKHSENEVIYTLVKLQEAGYISAEICRMESGHPDFLGIFEITFSGHQFLETIRDNRVWSKTKIVADKVGTKAFDFISKIASTVIAELIKTQLTS